MALQAMHQQQRALDLRRRRLSTESDNLRALVIVKGRRWVHRLVPPWRYSCKYK